MKLEEPPHRRGRLCDGRLSSTVPWERKGETPLRDPIVCYFKKKRTKIKPFNENNV
jgi:hypothetical protein